MTIEMIPTYWQAAETIAQHISHTDTDGNELKKVVAYLCWLRNRKVTVDRDRLFAYLGTLSQHGEVRSGKSMQHYQTIEYICRTQLQDLPVDGNALIQILGWAARLYTT
ncbi:MAG: hypothetical protein RBJ76_29035 [Stenomitos frigidus ULC029]